MFILENISLFIFNVPFPMKFILLYATIFCEADIYYETWSKNKFELKLKRLIF